MIRSLGPLQVASHHQEKLGILQRSGQEVVTFPEHLRSTSSKDLLRELCFPEEEWLLPEPGVSGDLSSSERLCSCEHLGSLCRPLKAENFF